jgi:hypothetical protein
VRALRQYLDAEGAEIIEDTESFAELDRGEVVTSEDLRRSVTEIIGGAEKARAQQNDDAGRLFLVLTELAGGLRRYPSHRRRPVPYGWNRSRPPTRRRENITSFSDKLCKITFETMY